MSEAEIVLKIVSGSGILLLLGIGYYYCYCGHRGYRALGTNDNLSKTEENVSNSAKTSRSRKRSLSYSSELLIDGVFPTKVNESPSLINIVLLFETVPSAEKLINQFQHILRYDRFRSTPKKDPKTKRWLFKYSGMVDIGANHLRTSVVNSESEMMSKIEEILATDIPGYGSIPLWQLHRIENHGKGVSALILRVHHVISDGIGLIGSISTLFTKAGTDEPLKLDIPEKMKGSQNQVENSGIRLILKTVSSFFEVIYLAISRHDSDIVFTSTNKNKLVMTKTRKVVLFPTIQLEFVKKIKNLARVTINDLLLTVMSGVILRYCQAKNDPLLTGSSKKNVQNRVLIPLAFPRPKEELETMSMALRNKWAFISVPMPLNESSSTERLKKCNESTQTIKTSPNPFIQYWLQNTILPCLPSFLAKQTAFDLMSRHSMVFSNLPGVEYPIALCNQTMVGIQVVFHNILPQVLLISYGGSIFCNMSLDTDFVKDSEELLPKFYLEELKDMAKSLGLNVDEKEILTSMSPGGIFGMV